jgi:hypothetical protein
MNTGRTLMWVGLLTMLFAAVLADAQTADIPSAQPASEAILGTSDLQADVALLRRAYTTLHSTRSNGSFSRTAHWPTRTSHSRSWRARCNVATPI